MAQNTATNPDAITKEQAVDELGAEPGESVSPVRLHTAIDHRAAFVGGAPLAISPDDCPT